jgi:hypothetical protein
MSTCLGRGHLSFRLRGEKLCGGYGLTRIREGAEETWLLLKRSDDEMNQPELARSSRTLDELS